MRDRSEYPGAAGTIRFIDSDYRELFQIPDGASITIAYPPGDGRGTLTRSCHHIDEAHVRIGDNDYHICEFAERMEALGARYEPTDQLRGAAFPATIRSGPLPLICPTMRSGTPSWILTPS